ncbi:hypothetical protein ACFST9_20295 [Hymenobacter monticola]|uniref:Mechanosensitive ion channel family protein n=1 Tax=Hymenobacter monticola TaxID=1705399 RepID=A0ABY4B992_9BACT|nr:hypothetical protein [Hymenobacter monticola]UOE34556.1 hypothetical protein MTP16_02620 [Hymenobacter monticola]
MLEFHHAFDLLSRKLTGWVQQFILLPNLLIALLILVATFFAARLVRRLVTNLLGRVSGSGTLNNLVVTVCYVGVLLVGMFFTL